MVDTEEADMKYCNGSVKKWFVYLQNRMAAFLKDFLLLMEEVVRLLQKKKTIREKKTKNQQIK